MSNSAVKKSVFILVPFLIFTFIASYLFFAQYRPKSLKQVEEVKGLSDESISSFPFPQGSEKVGSNKSDGYEQVTFNTSKSKQEVQDFYANIFTGKKWELDSRGIYNDFIITRYKDETSMVTIISYDTQDPNKTLVSIESAIR